MSRSYTINDIDFPSVTSILGLLDKPYLLPWAAEQGAKYVLDHILEHGPDETLKNHVPVLESARLAHTKVSGAAKDIGSDVHHLLEIYITRKIEGNTLPIELQDYCEEVVFCWTEFLKWEAEKKPYWIASEKSVCNPSEGYAGTLDAVCDIGGDIYVIDFKTDKQVSETYPMQIAAYLKAYNSEGGKATHAGILRLPKDGQGFDWLDYTERLETNYEAFCGLLWFYYHAKKRRLKNNPRVMEIWG